MEYVDHILTNEKAYRIRDIEAARVDNEAIGATVWDSKTLIERLCPAFAVSGYNKPCYPVEGYPLTVVTQIDPQLEACELLQLEHETPAGTVYYEKALGQPAYGGSFNWTTGILELTRASFTIDENTDLRKHPDGTRYYVYGGIPGMQTGSFLPGICGAVLVISVSYEMDFPGLLLGMDNNYAYLCNMEKMDPSIVDVDSLKTYLQRNPIRFVYSLATPVRIDLGAVSIAGGAGENRFRGNTSDIKVSGKASIAALLGDGQHG